MEVNLNLYKGFVRTKGKQAIDKLKSGVYREWEEIKQYNSYAGVLQDDVILIDIDDMRQSDIIMNISEQKQINTYVYQTSRGRHFLFKNDNRITKCYTHTRLACGLYADIKIGSATSVQALKVDGEERFCEWGFDNLVDTIPTNTLTIEVNANTSIIVVSILPILFGCFIFPIDVLIVKKISGTIITSNIFKNKSPNGLNTVAFSSNISPTIVPIIIDAKSINVDL